MNPCYQMTPTRSDHHATFDGVEIDVSDRMKDALKELMAAECEMLAGLFPDFANHYTWGRVRVGDLSLTNRFSFEFGGSDDHPGGPDFDVA